MESFNEVFAEVLKYCYSLTNENKISEQGYNMWIKVLEPYKLENNTAYLLADSDFVKNTALTAYGAAIKEAFAYVLGFDVDLKILVKSEGNSVEKDEAEIEVKTADFSEDAKNSLTFDNFIKGKSNELAYAFCIAVANKYDKNSDNSKDIDPNKVFNPLIIYGDSGLGKTHLMKAIEHEVKKKNPEMKIIYTTGESFINELVKALEFKDTIRFHEKYRNADFLLVDDIQTIAGKDRMQEEFFHTFNDLYNAGKQIVLTSDIAPSKISKLQNRILNRFSLGVQVDVTLPDFETRMAIVKRKAEILDLQLSDSIARIIAEKIKTNIRQLEGTVNKIKALTTYTNENPSISMAQRVIKEIIIENHPAEITVDRILNEVAAAFDLTADDIKSTHRHQNISIARKVSIYVLKEVKGMTYTEIGEALNKNHSTMTIHYKEIEKTLKENSQLKETVDDIIKNLKER
ncbi:chromosomal replication initiator protein DnaA [uncultured Ruminococcus sp.]|uniref:chromosomal replication initiator protein DnaA n=1 Tax=uncultured Ruminococcus sp. TaxID=165186 RepID=UPI0025D75486|nr:chromosomal replication initiator protein DnaA [uncultured Ruminococcus sp.]